MFGRGKTPTVRVITAKYLGGHDRLRPVDGTLVISPEKGAEFKAAGRGFTEPWDRVVSVTVDPMRKTTEGALLLLELADGRTVMFDVPKVPSANMQAQLSVLLPYLPA